MGKKNKVKNQPNRIQEQPRKFENETTKKIEANSNSSILPWILTGIIAFICFAIYSNTFQHRFVLDDHGIIKNNKITKAPLSWENTKTIFSTPHRKGDVSDLENSLYRPFTKLVFNIEWNLFNGNTDSFNAAHKFHVVNVMLYVLLCGFIFWVLYKAFNNKWLLPFLITLLFAVHPMHAEVVANIKSGDEILSLLGIIMAIFFIQLYLKNEKLIYFILAIFSFMFGLYSKESTVVAILIFPAFIYYFTNTELKKNIIISGVMLGCSIIFLLSRHSALAGYPPPSPLSALDNYLVLTSGASKFASAINTLGFYIYTFFVPYPLSCDYSYSTLAPITPTNLGFVFSFLMFLALFAFAIWKFKEKSAIGFGILWFFISMSIVSNVFFLIGTSFGERLFFTPSLGLCIALVCALTILAKKQHEENTISDALKKYSLPVIAILVVSALYSFKTHSRNEDWKSDFKLFSKDIENYPNSTHLLFYMGNHLAGTERKDVLTDEMMQLGYNQAQINDSAAKESAKSIYYFNRSLSIYPALPSDGYNQLGKAYFNVGQLDSALKYYTKAYSEDSTNGIFYNNIGTVYYNKGLALINQQNLQEAIPLLLQSFPYFTTAHQRDTTESDFMNNIGCVYGTLNKPDSAIYWFEKALAKDSADLTSIQFLDITWRNKGNVQLADYYKAMADRTRALKTQQLRQ